MGGSPTNYRRRVAIVDPVCGTIGSMSVGRLIPALAIIFVAAAVCPGIAAAQEKDLEKPYIELQVSGLGGAIHRKWTGGFDVVFAAGGKGFYSSLIAPMRFDSGGLRDQDWDEVSDYGRILGGLGYRTKSGDISVGFESLKGYTLGAGNLVSMFYGTVDTDHWRTGIFAKLHWDPAGADLFLDSFLGPSVFGGRIYVRPLWFVDKNGLVGKLEFGVSVATDIFAPYTLGSILPDEHGLVSQGSDAVTGWSVDMRWPLRAADWAEVTPWTAWSRIGLADAGHVGLDLAFRINNKFRLTVQGEWRFMESGFAAGYFDNLYMADRYDFGSWRNIFPGAVSKQAFLESGSFDRMGGSVGVMAEWDPWLSAWFRADIDEDGFFTRYRMGVTVTVPKRLILTGSLTARGFGAANDDAAADRLNGSIVADVTVWKFVGVFASYSRDLYVPVGGSDIGRYVGTDTALVGLRLSFGLLSDRKKKK